MTSLAEIIVEDIIYEMTDRGGFDAIWCDLDDELQTEIRNAWVAIVMKHLNRSQ